MTTLKRKKFLSVIMAVLLLLSLSAVSSAYKLSNAVTLKIKAETIPEGTDYIDLLVPVKTAEKEKIYNEKPVQSKLFSLATMGIIEVAEDGEINNLSDGFCSFYLHINGSSISMPQKTDDGYIQIDYDIENGNAREFFGSCKNCKLVFVDRDGKILLTGGEFNIRENALRDLNSIIADSQNVTVKYQVLYNKIVIIIVLIGAVAFIAVKIKNKFLQPPKNTDVKKKKQ